MVIGAVAHDLGHGPFSHMFEKFIRKVRPEVSWSHETASIAIFQRIVDKLGDVFQRYGLDDDDILFIKEIIYGPLDGSSVSSDQPWPYKGRDQSKAFLYEIVANKSCSIDVDKVYVQWKRFHVLIESSQFDYLLRDSASVKMPVKFDYG